MRLSKLAVMLLTLLVISPILQLGPPPASALGCYSSAGHWSAEGPYLSSAQGFVNIENRTVNKLNSNRVYSVFTVEPGTEAKMKFGYLEDANGDQIINFTLKPVVDLQSPSATAFNSWLNVTFVPNLVIVPVWGGVNVTMLLNVSKDAPPGNYSVNIYGERQDSDEYERTNCPYAPLEISLRVVQEKNASGTITKNTTVITTTTITSTSTSTTSLPTTITSTSTTTFIERTTEPSVYAWALGATAVAAILAVVALRRKR